MKLSNLQDIVKQLPDLQRFAKSLWGEELSNSKFMLKAFGEYRPNWQCHLMHMVIAEDPLEYLATNLPEEKQE